MNQTWDRIFATFDKADSPGCVLGVIKDGQFIYRKRYGKASLELGVPLSPKSVVYMGSVSKQHLNHNPKEPSYFGYSPMILPFRARPKSAKLPVRRALRQVAQETR